MTTPILSLTPNPNEAPIRIIFVIRRRIATWVEGKHEAWGALILLSAFAAVVQLGYSRHAAAQAHLSFLNVASYGLSIALASLMVGLLLGFLFGIPRTLTGSNAGSSPEPSSLRQGNDSPISQPGSGNAGQAFGTNTNLEQISDWLTKILVGVGLTQIAKLPAGIRILSSSLAPGFGSLAGAGTLAVLTASFYSVCGFLIGYLWTRIYLAKEFVSVEREMTTRILEKVSSIESANAQVTAALSTVQEQPDKDAAALGLAQRLLDPAAGDTPIAQDEMNKVVATASPAVKVQLFYLGKKFRKEHKENRSALSRAIPLFRALIEADQVQKYHRTHAQLAYVLKDQLTPDLSTAIQEITKAISIRGSSDKGYRIYEIFRALCNIELMGKTQDEEAKKQLKIQILTDLKTAGKEDLGNLKDVSPVVAWMRSEQVNDADLI